VTGLAGFDFQALNARYRSYPSNDATSYGVSIMPTKAVNAWRCIGAYHLTPDENRGRRNIFLELLDEHGNRVKDAIINWSESLDRPIKTKRPDKPDNEPAADIPLNGEDTVTVYITDDKGTSSDSVGNLHFRHDRPGSGDVWGHNSFYVVFQRNAAMMPPVDPPVIIDPEPPTGGLTVEQRLDAQDREIAMIKWRLDNLEGVHG
jgi:hypothetical protein